MRNYASLQEIQEGNVIPDDKQLAITGMPINKSTMSIDIRNRLQRTLLEELMLPEDIDFISIIKALAIIEHEIYQEIMNGSTKYYKPDNIAPIQNYKKNPLSVNGVVASMIYNKLRDENMEAINLNERNYIIKIKLNVTKDKVESIKETYPDVYQRMIELMEDPQLGKKFNVIALPTDEAVPRWILPFVDIAEIVNTNLRNFPLEAVGLKRLEHDAVNYTNIVSF